uniref:BPI2 domain-containing protein n=1 Tax=Heligmosomoides polygyrus TaxID=6339 RepID=A0A183GS07_HELPZ
LFIKIHVVSDHCNEGRPELSGKGSIKQVGISRYRNTETGHMNSENMILGCSEHHKKPNSKGLRQRLIRLHLTPSTPGVAQFLRTSCENSFCLADLIPQLSESYPNHTLEVSLATTRAPAVLFSEKKGGVISVSLGGVVVVFVNDGTRRKQAAVLDVEVVADAKLNLQDRNVSGTVELTKFELTSRSGIVKISRGELSDISILVSQMIQNMLNDLLSGGFPLPVPHGERIIAVIRFVIRIYFVDHSKKVNDDNDPNILLHYRLPHLMAGSVFLVCCLATINTEGQWRGRN